MFALRLLVSVAVTAIAWLILAALAIWVLAGTANAALLLGALHDLQSRAGQYAALTAMWRERVILQGGLVGAGLLLLYQLGLVHVLVLLAANDPSSR